MKTVHRVVSATVLAAGLLAGGCGGVPTKATLGDSIPFTEREARISQIVGLYIDPESRAYVAQQSLRKDAGMSKDSVTFTVEIGQALEPNALRSLGKVFERVVVVDRSGAARGGGERPAWVVELAVNPATSIKIHPMAFGTHRVDIHLDARLRRADGTVLLTRTYSGEGAEGTAKGLLAAGVFGEYARASTMNALGQAGEQSLYLSLEAFNTDLLEQKDSLFRRR